MNAISPTIIPKNELQRMAAVRRFNILDTPPDAAFDRITAIAARRFDVPIAAISIVDEDRIWFKSRHGLPVTEIGRDPGLCATAILSNEPYVLSDATADPRSLANPLVAGEFGLRFYAGVPLQTSDGHNLGTLCVIDHVARSIDQAQMDDLRDLACVVIDQMELRLAARLEAEQSRLMAREIDHRVMNSLQFISGMLTIQSRRAAEGSAAQLESAATRVLSVARVHRQFCSREGAHAKCLAFLRRLCADLSAVLGRAIIVTGDDGDVPTEWVQPIGLIVNELVTNAAKHGAGRIDVAYRVEAGARHLSVCDEGKGLPASFDLAKTSGLGMKVVNTLARQLGGKLTAAPGPDGRGMRFTVSI